MKKIIAGAFAMIVLVSCASTDISEREELNTKVSKACEDSTWLNETLEALKTLDVQARLTQFTYQGEHVFMIEGCIGCPDYPTTVYTCDGTQICSSGSIGGPHTCGDFFENATHKKVIWHN